MRESSTFRVLRLAWQRNPKGVFFTKNFELWYRELSNMSKRKLQEKFIVARIRPVLFFQFISSTHSFPLHKLAVRLVYTKTTIEVSSESQPKWIAYHGLPSSRAAFLRSKSKNLGNRIQEGSRRNMVLFRVQEFPQ